MGHNYYGEPAWPNDLSYIFPVVILGTIACTIGLAVLEPSMIGEPANPFATPLEILPEWYFFPVFQILRTVPNRLLGVLLMGSVPAGSLTVPFLENVNQFQNPFRRPVATTVSLIGTAVALWLGIGAALPIDESLTLGLFQFDPTVEYKNISIFLFIYLGSSCFKTNYISLDIPILSDISFEYSTKERYVKDSHDSPKELGERK